MSRARAAQPNKTTSPNGHIDRHGPRFVVEKSFFPSLHKSPPGQCLDYSQVMEVLHVRSFIAPKLRDEPAD